MLCVTGAAGFIGSNFVLQWFQERDEPVVSLDKLTYAGNRANLKALDSDSRHCFERGDIGDSAFVSTLFQKYSPRAIINFAAESHVDRSISGPAAFIETNILGTFRLLETSLAYWKSLPLAQQQAFRFLHISTDEVFGSLDPDHPAFCEESAFNPNSPYSASKASADHLVRAYGQTYGLPVLTVHCSNNYGPHQFPEKLIPLMIHNALAGKSLPVYGDGLHVRDWLYVTDHCSALRLVLQEGRVGETYNVGGQNEISNIDLVHRLCDLLDAGQPSASGASYRSQIVFVKDRLGHDRRYAVNANKIEQAFGWRPAETLESGLAKTIAWYKDNPEWVEDVTSGAYRDWISTHYGVLSTGEGS